MSHLDVIHVRGQCGEEWVIAKYIFLQDPLFPLEGHHNSIARNGLFLVPLSVHHQHMNNIELIHGQRVMDTGI